MKFKSVINPNAYFLIARRTATALRSYHYAKRRNISSLAFDRLGRRLGVMQAFRGRLRRGLREILNPISLVRYFEFDFCLRQLPRSPRTILDVSSPRLFPLYLATQITNAKFILLNPDPYDIEITRYFVKLLGLRNVETRNQDLHGLLSTYKGTVDFLTSISVLEHIAGEYDDKIAMALMLEYLKPGGVFVLTVPLSKSKQHEDEYFSDSNMPYKGTHNVRNEDGRFFFQRLYSAISINERLLSQLRGQEAYLEWWGERKKGIYKSYRYSSRYNQGYDCRAFVDNFIKYNSYQQMPGMGICGIRIVK